MLRTEDYASEKIRRTHIVYTCSMHLEPKAKAKALVLRPKRQILDKICTLDAMKNQSDGLRQLSLGTRTI